MSLCSQMKGLCYDCPVAAGIAGQGFMQREDLYEVPERELEI